MPKPEEFFEEEEILEDTEVDPTDEEGVDDEEELEDEDYSEEEFDEDESDESDEGDESEEELSEDDDSDEDEDYIDEDEDDSDLEDDVSEEYEVVSTSDTDTDFGGGKIKKWQTTDGLDGKNRSTIVPKLPFKGKAKIPDKSDFTMSEHVSAMFEGADLTDEFKTKATAVFEAAVNERYDSMVARLEEAYETAVEENTAKILDELSSRVNDYISYIAEEWLKENRLVAEAGIKTEIAENFLRGIRDVFAENYVQVPEEKIDLVSEMSEENEVLRNEINERAAEAIELRKEILALRCNDIFESHCEGLASTQVERLRTLAEGIEFDSEELFEQKLTALKESYFGGSRRVRKPVSASTDLVEEIVLDTGDEEENLQEQETTQTNPIMEKYASVLSKKGFKNR
jgi:AcrR family transcriptional regulator